MEKANGKRRWLKALQPRAVIFGFSLGLFVLTLVHDYHLHTLNNQAGYSPWVGSAEDEVATFFLVLGSLGLLLRKWWSHLIAIVLAGKIVYNPGYLTLWIYANVSMSDGSLWRFATWKGWYYFTLETQPQYFLHTLVGGIICCYAAIELMRQVLRFNRTRANNPSEADESRDF